MDDTGSRPLLDLLDSAQSALIAGARDRDPVRGLTHNYYRYPARFSPAFARTVIETFTHAGDLVLDNHVGGGTSLVEALALGRHAVGIDISALAEFVASIKTTVFGEAELRSLEAWAHQLPHEINIRKWSIHFGDHAALGYYRHLDHPSRWRLRKAIEQGLGSAIRLGSPRLQSFGRCVVLRTAQWALDGRRQLPSLPEFREMMALHATDMVAGARAFAVAVCAHAGAAPTVQVINRSAAGLEHDERAQVWQIPRLVITSPPYPGIHVLYHRWQVDGRKETSLPFMIADKLDGAAGSYYTMGDRKYPELRTYFDNVRATMSSVVALADENTVVVQMVAFSEPRWQLKRYLETMKAAGLQEVSLPSLQGEGDGRLWRSVPGRRWYSDQRGETPGSQEVVLIHRKSLSQSQLLDRPAAQRQKDPPSRGKSTRA